METVLQQHNIDQSAFFSSGLFATSESFWRGFGPQNSNRSGLVGKDGERANSEDKRSGASGSGHSAPPAEQGSSKQPPTEDGLEETQAPSIGSAKKRQSTPQLGRTVGSTDVQARGVPTRAAKQSKAKGAATSNSKRFLTMEQAPSEVQKRDQELKRVVQAQGNPNVAAVGKRKGKRKKDEMEPTISQVPLPQQTNQHDNPTVMSRAEVTKRAKTKLSGVKEAKVGVEFPANKPSSPRKRSVDSQIEAHMRSAPPPPASAPLMYSQQQPSQKPEHVESYKTHEQVPQVSVHIEEMSRNVASLSRPGTAFDKGAFRSAGNLNTALGSKSSLVINPHNNIGVKSTSQGLASGLASQNTLDYQSGLGARGVSEDTADDGKSTAVCAQRDEKQSEMLGITGPASRIDSHPTIPALRSANVYAVKPEATANMGAQVSDSHAHSYKAGNRVPGALSMHTAWQPPQQQPRSHTHEFSNDSVRSVQRGASPDMSMTGSALDHSVGEKQDPASHTLPTQAESGWKQSPGGVVPSDRSDFQMGIQGAIDQMNQV